MRLKPITVEQREQWPDTGIDCKYYESKRDVNGKRTIVIIDEVAVSVLTVLDTKEEYEPLKEWRKDFTGTHKKRSCQQIAMTAVLLNFPSEHWLTDEILNGLGFRVAYVK
jgi:hypothetical protein